MGTDEQWGGWMMLPKKPKQPKAYRRSVRKQQVLAQLKIWRQNGYATEATSYKLAHALQIEPTQRFRCILNEMVAEGDLLATERTQPGRWVTKFYSLTEKHVNTERFSRRSISIRKRGVSVGQLEMFS